MEHTADKTIGALRAINRVIALLMGVVLMGCVAFILVEIGIRQTGGSLGGTDEIAGYVMAIVTSWGMAYCLLELGHVRIDIIRARLGDMGRALVDLICLAALGGVATLIAVKAWPVVERSVVNGSRANTPLETPLALVQIPWFAGWVWFAIASWITLVAAATMVLGRRFAEAESVIGVVAEAEAAQEEAKGAL